MMPAPAEWVLALSQSDELSILSKMTVVLVVGLLAAQGATRARASVRHLLLAATFAAVVAIPVVVRSGPAITFDVPVAGPTASPVPVAPGGDAAGLAPPGAATRPTAPANRWSSISWLTIARAGWFAGTLIFLARLGLVLWRLRRVRRTGLPWTNVRASAQSLAHDRGINRPVEILRHEDVPAPVTFGVRRRVIVMPADAVDWSEADLRRALVHEMEHITRSDWAVQIAARAICACYWFHPLVWVAWRRLSLEAERACDDAVVVSEESTDYAEQLVSLAERLSAAQAQPTLGMANRSDLSARVSAVLDAGQRRGRAGVWTSAGAIGMAGLVVLAVAPVRAVATFIGPAGDAIAATVASAAIAAATAPTETPAPAASDEQRAPAPTPRERFTSTAAARAINAGLIEAIEDGDIDEVAGLLDAGADVNAVVRGDGSPLIAAAESGHSDVVALLLNRGADVNLAVSGDGSPLIAAAESGHRDVVALLLNSGADVNLAVSGDGSPLIAAAESGHSEIVALLLNRGADVNLPVSGDGSPLIAAVESGHGDVVALLLNRGADVNLAVSGDGSPLIAAVESGHSDVVALLLDRGADVNLAVSGDGNPLIAAAGNGHIGIVTLLLDRGADIDRVVPGDENALIQASGEGHLDVVKRLVARGANVNARVAVDIYTYDWGGANARRPRATLAGQEWRTPLSMARRGNHAAVVQYLTAVGAVD